ncbi:MAG: hypothetical protein KGQ52_14465 [Alphaproteobacteria bacterium]|nr:hypothetical protein [Alphaproteobacteria bacterium]
MFNETDPELEEKASGLALLAIWAAALFAGWCLVCAAWFFIARAAVPAATALWSLMQ